METNKLLDELLTYQLAIFDLDGVIVDTARYHFLAWKELADSMGFRFDEEDNERLKGVSRMRSLDIILEINNAQLDDNKRAQLADKKNRRYIELVKGIQPHEVLPGAKELLEFLRGRGVKTAIGSASKNAGMVLQGLDIMRLFDEVIDGNSTQKTKPDPEVFTLSADRLGVPYSRCIVFEDAQAGIDAALAAGMTAVAIGRPDNLKNGKYCISGLDVFEIYP